MSKLFTTTLRINHTKPEGRKAWAYLKNRDKSRYRSYNDAIIAAVNEYFDREKLLADDPYLETREKEDVFLQRVLETVQQGVQANPLTGLSKLGDAYGNRYDYDTMREAENQVAYLLDEARGETKPHSLRENLKQKQKYSEQRELPQRRKTTDWER